jgi:hypothetical protein
VGELRPFYSAFPGRLVHVHSPEAEHLMPPKDWKKVWDQITEFLERFLPEGSPRRGESPAGAMEGASPPEGK